MGEAITKAMAAPPMHADAGGRRWWVYRQLKRPFFGRFMKPWRWPKDVARDGWETVTIASRSHARLAAAVKRTPHVPRGVVVCAHPMGLAAKGFWLRNGHADALLAAGWHVVAFDFNGFGESPSTNFDWPGDAVGVGQWARSQFPGLPVHALAASFGAMHTLNAIDDAQFPYDAVIAEGCPHSLPAFWRHYPAAYALLRASQLVRPAMERQLRPTRALAGMKPGVRVLFLHGERDRWTPPSNGERLVAAAPAGRDVQHIVLRNADHTHGLRDDRAQYLSAVLNFFAGDAGQQHHATHHRQ